ncbi:MAG: hypothetical protein K6G33_09095 [Ruminococcus sp.]|uniref:Ig-like domain-containing protein n=1 Tax=Ruminococcus sp. TaxID=41978 RepID=UPI0025DCD362|nr:Ig-like domain-containing protein [Ruminococcus sp.]MCR5600878.1 hypothetical protein [Ruminococcus sp.]
MNNGGFDLKRKIAFAAALIVVSHSVGAMPIASAAPVSVKVQNVNRQTKAEENNEEPAAPAETTTSAAVTTSAVTTSAAAATTTVSETTAAVTTTQNPYNEYKITVNSIELDYEGFSSLASKALGDNIIIDVDPERNYSNTVKVPKANTVNRGDIYIYQKSIKFTLVSFKNNELVYDVSYRVSVDKNVRNVEITDENGEKLNESVYLPHGSKVNVKPLPAYMLDDSDDAKSFTLDTAMWVKVTDENGEGFNLDISNQKHSVKPKKFSINISNYHKVYHEVNENQSDETGQREFKWNEIDDFYIYSKDKCALIVSYDNKVETYELKNERFYLKDLLKSEKFKYINGARFNITGVNHKLHVKSMFDGSETTKESDINVEKGDGSDYIIRVPYLESNNYRLVSYDYKGNTFYVNNEYQDKLIDKENFYRITVDSEEKNITLNYSQISMFGKYSFVPTKDVYRRSEHCYVYDSASPTPKFMNFSADFDGSNIYYSFLRDKNSLESGKYSIVERSRTFAVDVKNIGYPKFIFVTNILKNGDVLEGGLENSICFYDDKNAPGVTVEPKDGWSGKDGLEFRVNTDDSEECPVSGGGESFYEQNLIKEVFDKYINDKSDDKQQISALYVGDYRFDRPADGWKDGVEQEGTVETLSITKAENALITVLAETDLSILGSEYASHPETDVFYQGFVRGGGCTSLSAYYTKLAKTTPEDEMPAEAIAFEHAFAAYNKAVDSEKTEAAALKRKVVPTLVYNAEENKFIIKVKAVDKLKDTVIENKKLVVYAVDNNGNSDPTGKSETVTVNLDGEAPVIHDKNDKKISVGGTAEFVREKDGVSEYVIRAGSVISAYITDKGMGLDKGKCGFGTEKEPSFIMSGDDSGKFTYTFSDEELDKELKSFISIKASDRAGNDASLNSGETAEKIKVIIDKTAPESEILNSSVSENCFIQVTGEGEDKQEKKWFRNYSDVRMDIRAADLYPDKCSGIRSLSISVNGREKNIVLADNGISEEKLNAAGKYYVALESAEDENFFNAFLRSSDDKKLNVLICENVPCISEGDQSENIENGSVRIGFCVEDFAHNYSAVKYETVYVDLSDPTVVSAEVNGRNFIRSGDYCYDIFGRSEAVVSIRVTDDAPSSGFASVYASLYNENDELAAEKIIAERLESADIWNVRVPVDFKGYLVIYAVDNVGRISPEVRTNGIITESEEKHSEEPHINFVLPSTSHKDRDGRPLYSSDISVDITAEDKFSGIAEIITSVTGRNSSSVTVNAAGEVSGADAGEWHDTPNNREYNLVSRLSRKLDIAQDSNNIVVDISLKDQAGNPLNTPHETVNFSIDKTDPKIDVTYTDLSGNPENGSKTLYNTARRALITVTERNFDSSLAEVLVNGSRRSVSWSHVSGTEGTDDAKYRAEVTFEADGNYDLNVKCTDMGGRTANEYKQSFEIDRTPPSLSVGFDKSVTNSHYYNEPVTATLRISDVNFDAQSINITGTYNNKSDGFPTASAWTKSGNEYVSSIRFEKNGEYEITVSGRDKAGNALETYNGSFCIDTKKPAIRTDNVSRSNNGSEIRPRIEFTDTNLNKDSIKIELDGANRGKSLEYSGELIEKKDGYEYVFDNFPQTAEYDDIYTIRASAKDNANNKLEQNVSFSVNRFGSTFSLDEATAFVIGRFISEPRDIVITERNADKHAEPSKVYITRDTEMIELTERKDYAVEEKGGKNEWAEYRYVIYAKNFDKDAKYTVSIHSVDEAGNINVSAALKKNAAVSFSVDKTAPLCIPLNISENSAYKGESHTAKLCISDNVALKEVKVYVNGDPAPTRIDNDEYSFEIYNSPHAQEISVVLTDMADNEIEYNYRNILVTTSVLRLLIRKTWFKIAGIAALLLAGAATFFIRRRRRLR